MKRSQAALLVLALGAGTVHADDLLVGGENPGTFAPVKQGGYASWPREANPSPESVLNSNPGVFMPYGSDSGTRAGNPAYDEIFSGVQNPVPAAPFVSPTTAQAAGKATRSN